MNELDKNQKEMTEIKSEFKKEVLKLIGKGLGWLPGLLGGMIPVGLIGTGGVLMLFGAFVEEVYHRFDMLGVASVMAGLIFLFFGIFGLVKQSHALFLRLLAGGKK